MFTTHDVSSSQIRSLAFDPDLLTARVTFMRKDGSISAVWDYCPISQADFDLWLNSDSIGKFFNSRVKSVVPGTKVG